MANDKQITKDWFKPNAIPQAEVKVGIDKFENAIREIGVGFACEWMGHEEDGHFAKETVDALCKNADIDSPFELKDGEYILIPESEYLANSFDGMTDRESVNHQVKHWANGTPLHNPIRDECCPDFSCCNGGDMMPEQARKRLQEAYNEGDNETVQQICISGLTELTGKMGTKVHIVDEDQNKTRQ